MSNAVTPNSDQCVQFYVYDEQKSKGYLNLYAKAVHNESVDRLDMSTLEFPVWTSHSLSYERESWRRVQVPLSHFMSSQPYAIVLEKYVAPSDTPTWFFTYVDDIFIRDESCMPPGDCDFDHGLCRP